MMIIEVLKNFFSDVYDYCMENKKQSLIIAAIALIAIYICGYFTLIIAAKIISFVFALILGVLGLLFSFWYISIPLGIVGFWYWKNRD